VACHLGSFNGNSRVPRLANQHPEYLEKTMLDFKTRTRNNMPDMSNLISTYSDEEIKALAQYLGAFSGK
jgi:cytochrome c553